MTNWFRTATRYRDPVGAKRVAHFIDLLSRLPPGHLVDLGAGHGLFSRVAVELGWRVTAVDVRDERFPEDTNIEWVVADVRDFDGYGDADVVACLGLWYHLTLADQLQLVQRIAPRPLILDTHVAMPARHPAQHNSKRVSPIVTRGGYAGRLYDESGLESHATASWGNEVSFWPSVASLERQMYGAGYEVFEQISPPYRSDRGFFLARPLGNGVDLDRMVEKYIGLGDADTAPDEGPLATLAPRVAAEAPAPPPAPRPQPAASERASRTRSPAGDLPPVRRAAKQFGASLKRSARQRVARLRNRAGS